MRVSLSMELLEVLTTFLNSNGKTLEAIAAAAETGASGLSSTGLGEAGASGLSVTRQEVAVPSFGVSLAEADCPHGQLHQKIEIEVVSNEDAPLFYFSQAPSGNDAGPSNAGPSNGAPADSLFPLARKERVLPVEQPHPRVAPDEAGPSHRGLVSSNRSLEASLRARVQLLEREGCQFLAQDYPGEYWEDVSKSLSQATSQGDYGWKLDFESSYLQLIEKKHSCYMCFHAILSAHPYLLEQYGQSDPDEAFLSFFEETRKELLKELDDSFSEAELHEIGIIEDIKKDFFKHGPRSYYIYQILTEY